MLSPKDFLDVVKKTPLVSIDLILRDAQGNILLGLRNNNPARHTWFVPGGVIFKDERIADAFRRITRNELGRELSIESARFRGVFEHFYDENFADAPGFGTHYVVLAHELTVTEPLATTPDQHRQCRWWSPAEILAAPDVHEHTKDYFR